MAGGMMQKLIERNSTIPTNKSQASRSVTFNFVPPCCFEDFTTAEDYQDHVEIKAPATQR